MNPDGFVARLRRRETLLGYWISVDSPVLTERVATVGYIGVDGQHGVTGPGSWPLLMMAVDAGRHAAGSVGRSDP